jgi:hypothetical protein
MWKSMIGEPPAGFSKVRWWCKAEIAMQIARHFGREARCLPRQAPR